MRGQARAENRELTVIASGRSLIVMEGIIKRGKLQWLAVFAPAMGLGFAGCQREAPAEKSQAPQPASVVDQAAQEAVDAIKTPMDKARGVKGRLG